MAENTNPVAGTVPPMGNPIPKPTHATVKVKPIIRRPTIGGTVVGTPHPGAGLKLPTQTTVRPNAAAAPSTAPKAMEQLKSVTQKLKGVTQEIPAQAILHKTGIIADQDLSEAQKAAAKARTARISLSDALGVAPVSDASAAPLKTIRIKRPVDIGAQSHSSTMKITEEAAAPKPAPAPAPKPAAPAAKPAAPAAAAPKPTITQRKTLKISRPGAPVRPSGKFGVKHPTAAPAAPTEGAEKPAEGAPVADIPDIPEMPAVAPFPAAKPAGDTVPDVPKAMGIIGIILQIAACVAMGALGYYLFEAAQTPLFCGGCGWAQ